MPASTPACPPRTPSPRRRGRSTSEEGVSEVIGQILVFGIISTLLVLSMFAFNEAHLGARDRVVELRAESVATRVAGLVVQASLVAEQQGNLSKVTFLADLPPDLEGLAYQVHLNRTAPAHIDVTVPALGGTTLASAALFSADASTSSFSFDVCGSTPPIPGGRLHVRFDLRLLAPGGCPGGTRTHALFLESAP